MEEIEICNQEELINATNVKNVIVSGFPKLTDFEYILQKSMTTLQKWGMASIISLVK